MAIQFSAGSSPGIRQNCIAITDKHGDTVAFIRTYRVARVARRDGAPRCKYVIESHGNVTNATRADMLALYTIIGEWLGESK